MYCFHNIPPTKHKNNIPLLIFWIFMQLIVTDPTIKLCVKVKPKLSQKDNLIMYITIKGKMPGENVYLYVSVNPLKKIKNLQSQAFSIYT